MCISGLFIRIWIVCICMPVFVWFINSIIIHRNDIYRFLKFCSIQFSHFCCNNVLGLKGAFHCALSTTTKIVGTCNMKPDALGFFSFHKIQKGLCWVPDWRILDLNKFNCCFQFMTLLLFDLDIWLMSGQDGAMIQMNSSGCKIVSHGSIFINGDGYSLV